MGRRKAKINIVDDVVKSTITVVLGVIFISELIKVAPDQVKQYMQNIGEVLLFTGFCIILLYLFDYFRKN